MALKVFAVGDLHSEFREDVDREHLIKVEADVCILTGDIGNFLQEQNLVETLNFYKNNYQYVIYVLGNHEYYNCRYDREFVVEKIRELCQEIGIIFLHRSTVKIRDVLFVGATLWSNIDSNSFKQLNDSNYVFQSKFDYIEEFLKDFRFLQKTLREHPKEKIVVATHHLPTYRLIHRRFKDSDMNSAFYTDILDELEMHFVKYWFCGHTHETTMHKYMDAILIVNPLGYPGEFKFSQVLKNVYEV